MKGKKHHHHHPTSKLAPHHHPTFKLVPRRLLPLDWHISRLEKKEYYSFVRYGDGEIKALLEDRGGAGGRHKYKLSPQLKKEMNQALLKYYEEPTLVFSCPFRMLKIMNEHSRSWLEEHKLIKIKWVDCTAFKGASNSGKLFPLIQELRKQKIIVIGPSFLRNLKKRVFNYLDFIEVDPKTGYMDRTVIPKVLECRKKYGDGLLYSFSMGPGTNVCIPNLHHEMLKNFLIDFGSVWDIFCGVRSRKYMNSSLYSDKTLQRNLGL